MALITSPFTGFTKCFYMYENDASVHIGYILERHVRIQIEDHQNLGKMFIPPLPPVAFLTVYDGLILRLIKNIQITVNWFEI
ncbi:MAG: hypothetical protein ACRCVL_02525, partial [Cetobacterium sp.]